MMKYSFFKFFRLSPITQERIKNWLEGAGSIDFRWKNRGVSASQMNYKIKKLTQHSTMSEIEAIHQVFIWRNQAKTVTLFLMFAGIVLFVFHTGFVAIFCAFLPWLLGLFYRDFILSDE
jgi:hypothetical protein